LLKKGATVIPGMYSTPERHATKMVRLLLPELPQIVLSHSMDQNALIITEGTNLGHRRRTVRSQISDIHVHIQTLCILGLTGENKISDFR
jgi:hypothetical protein